VKSGEVIVYAGMIAKSAENNSNVEAVRLYYGN
jgi:hypothetical protein